jgi:hypothetical protein
MTAQETLPRWVWASLALLAALALYVGLSRGGLTPKPFDGSHLLGLLTSLGFLALLVERTIEVTIGAARGETTAQLQAAAENAKLARASMSTSIAAHEVAEFRQAELIRFRAGTKSLALRVAVLLGLFVSAVGFRTLDQLVIATELETQSMLFRTLDVLMTAAVIGGGSDAIHRMISTITTYLDAVAQSARSRGSGAASPSPPVPILGIPPLSPGPPES